MKSILFAAVFVAGVTLVFTGGPAAAAAKSGETLFKQHCAGCHPNGGNILTAQKSLSKKDLEANKIRTAEDIVTVMRNPGPGMSKFDAKLVPDKEAQQIAEYILTTFK
jgi:cytochrome c6